MFEATLYLRNLSKRNARMCNCYSRNDSHKKWHMHWSKLVHLCKSIARTEVPYTVTYDFDLDVPTAHIVSGVVLPDVPDWLSLYE